MHYAQGKAIKNSSTAHVSNFMEMVVFDAWYYSFK